MGCCESQESDTKPFDKPINELVPPGAEPKGQGEVLGDSKAPSGAPGPGNPPPGGDPRPLPVKITKAENDSKAQAASSTMASSAISSDTTSPAPIPKMSLAALKKASRVSVLEAEIPNEDVLNKMFHDLMAERLLPEEKIQALSKTMNKQVKWSMVSEAKKIQKKTPVEWVAILFSPNLTSAQLNELRIEIMGAGKGFLEKWVASQGLRALLQKLDNSRLELPIRHALMEVLNAFANNGYGLHTIIDFPQAVDSIASVLLNGDVRLKKNIMRLLIALSYESEEGREAVMESLAQAKFHRRFEVLVKMVDEEKDLNLRIDVATLLNTLVSSPNEVERRVKIRYELLDLNYLNVLKSTEDYIAKERGDGSVPYKDFRTQVDVFDEERKQDACETLYNAVDLSDVDEVLHFMRDFAQKTGHSHDLLTSLHPLMKIPFDKSGDKTWKAVKHIIHKACDWFYEPPEGEGEDEVKEAKMKLAQSIKEIDEEMKDDENEYGDFEEADEGEVGDEPEDIEPLTYAELIHELQNYKFQSRDKERKEEEETKKILESLRKENHKLKLRESTLFDDVKKANKSLRAEVKKAKDAQKLVDDLKKDLEAMRQTLSETKEKLEQEQKTSTAQRERLDSAITKTNFTTEESGRMQSEIDTLKSENKALQDEITELKKKAAAGPIPPPPGAAGGIPPPPGAAGIPPPPGAAGIPPPPGAAGIPPPPGAAGIPPPPGMGAIPPPPGAAGIPPPPGAAGIPPPPGMGAGIPPPPGMGGVPPPPGMGGIPPPPGGGMPGLPPPPMMGAMPMFPSKPAVKLPYQKKKLDVKAKLKALHWKPLDLTKIEKTCWKSMSDQKVDFDRKALEEAFGVRKRKKGAKSPLASGVSPTRKKKKEVITLLDSKRSYNINIALARFKMSHESIRDALYRMDDIALDEDKLVALAKCKPEPEELEMVTHFDGDVSSLGSCEKFFRTIGEISGIRFRIDAFLFKVRFDKAMGELESTVNVLKMAQSTLRSSTNFKIVLEYVLALGNYLNHSNKKGGAYGIQLSSLDKLKGMKSADQKSNLLEFLVITLRKNQPDARKFVDEFGVLQEASRIDVPYLEAAVSKNVGMVNKIGNAAKSAKSDGTDRFGPVMTKFHETAKEQVDNLSRELKDTVSGMNEMVEFYGENPKKMPPPDFMQLLLDFASTFKKMEEMLDKKHELEERQKAREETKKNKSPKRKGGIGDAVMAAGGKIKLKKKDKNKIGFAMKSLRSGNAEQIRQALRRRQKFGTIKISRKSQEDVSIYMRNSSSTRLRKRGFKSHGDIGLFIKGSRPPRTPRGKDIPSPRR